MIRSLLTPCVAFILSGIVNPTGASAEGWRFVDVRQAMISETAYRLEVERNQTPGGQLFIPIHQSTLDYDYAGQAWQWVVFPHYGFYVHVHSIDATVATPNGSDDEVRGLVKENINIVNSTTWDTIDEIESTGYVLPPVGQ